MMKKELIKKYLNKRVRLNLSNHKVYTGEILDVDDDCLELLDKYGLNVTIANEIVVEIQQVR